MVINAEGSLSFLPRTSNVFTLTAFCSILASSFRIWSRRLQGLIDLSRRGSWRLFVSTFDFTVMWSQLTTVLAFGILLEVMRAESPGNVWPWHSGPGAVHYNLGLYKSQCFHVPILLRRSLHCSCSAAWCSASWFEVLWGVPHKWQQNRTCSEELATHLFVLCECWEIC